MASKERSKAKAVRPAPVVASSPRRGRPPQAPRTTLARWMRANGNMTADDLAKQLGDLAEMHGVPEHAPQPKTLLDHINGRYKPSLPVVMLIEYATSGDVKIEHWVRDLY